MTANTTATRKAKGRKFQQSVRQRLIDVLHLDSTDIESRSMGAQGTDIMLSAAARDKFPYAVECKCVEKLNIWDAWDQADDNATLITQPLLVIKRNRSPTLAVMTLDHMLFLIQYINQLRKSNDA